MAELERLAVVTEWITVRILVGSLCGFACVWLTLLTIQE